MNINTILNLFTPRDTKFFPLLKQSSFILVNAAIYAEKIYHCDDRAKIKELCMAVKNEEKEGDNVTADIFKELNETFITPFDREDIAALADSLDDVVDSIHRSSDKVMLYVPNHFPEATLRLSEIVKKGAEEVFRAIEELSNRKRNYLAIKYHCNEIKRLEEEADDIYNNGIKSLFQNETDAVELVKLKEIIQELEKSTNRINGTGKIIRSILVKYA